MVERTALATFGSQSVESVSSVDDALAKFWRPVHVLLFASSVELAAVMVALPPRAMLLPLTVTDEFCN